MASSTGLKESMLHDGKQEEAARWMMRGKLMFAIGSMLVAAVMVGVATGGNGGVWRAELRGTHGGASELVAAAPAENFNINTTELEAYIGACYNVDSGYVDSLGGYLHAYCGPHAVMTGMQFDKVSGSRYRIVAKCCRVIR